MTYNLDNWLNRPLLGYGPTIREPRSSRTGASRADAERFVRDIVRSHDEDHAGAVHEAGHALAMVVTGQPLVEVSLGRGGHGRTVRDTRGRCVSLREQLVATFAGTLAEFLARGTVDTDACRGDDDHADELAAKLDPAERDTILRETAEQARIIVELGLARGVIQAIADQLTARRRLTPADLDTLLTRARGSDQPTVDRWQQAVHRLVAEGIPVDQQLESLLGLKVTVEQRAAVGSAW